MKKYAIVQHLNSENKKYYWAYQYDWKFKLFGPLATSAICDTCSYETAEDCKKKLINSLANEGKYKIIEIVEL